MQYRQFGPYELYMAQTPLMLAIQLAESGQHMFRLQSLAGDTALLGLHGFDGGPATCPAETGICLMARPHYKTLAEWPRRGLSLWLEPHHGCWCAKLEGTELEIPALPDIGSLKSCRHWADGIRQMEEWLGGSAPPSRPAQHEGKIACHPGLAC